MKGEPARQQHDFDRHDRDRAPRRLSEQRQRDACKYIGARRAAPLENRVPGPFHVGLLRCVAGKLQRVVGLYGGAEIGFAGVKQRPPAIFALRSTQITGQFFLGFPVHIVQEVPQQDIFRRNGDVGFKFVNPVAILGLARMQRAARVLDGRIKPSVEIARRRFGDFAGNTGIGF